MLRTVYSLFMLAIITILLTLCVVFVGVFTGVKRKAYSFVRAWAIALVYVFRVKIKVSASEEQVDFSEPVVYMSNHLSMADIPILMASIPAGLSFISKNSLKKVPFLSWSMRMVGMVFIDRAKTTKSIKELDQAATEIPDNMNFMVFPEGTRSRKGGRRMSDIKKGGFYLARASQRRIQPVAVVGTEYLMPVNGLAIYPGTAEIRFGKPIEVKADSDINMLVSQYRHQMEELLKNPLNSEATARVRGFVKESD